jgi:LacI family repressor for deo operon, udp, cdd, tsx, nupC, and nupG
MANIKDIASLAGVSIATVSRAMSNPSVVREQTLTKIEAAVAELNYRPNMLASGLRRQRSDNIIVAAPSIFNPFTSAFVQGIENVAREAGYRVLLGITEADQVLLDSYVDMIAGKQADGLILLDTVLPSVIKQGGGEAHPPIVAACEYPPNLAIPRVRQDNVEAVAMLVNHLAKLGHTSIAAITGPINQFMAIDRLAGYRLGLKRAGLQSDDRLIADGDFSLESGHRAMRDLLARGLPLTGVCCANDEMAIGALAALREAGIDVPGEVSVVGFDNLRFGAYSSPPLTTIDVPTIETGETAMRLMLDLLRDPTDAKREVILPHRLVVRGSSGPAPAK